MTSLSIFFTNANRNLYVPQAHHIAVLAKLRGLTLDFTLCRPRAHPAIHTALAPTPSRPTLPPSGHASPVSLAHREQADEAITSPFTRLVAGRRKRRPSRQCCPRSSSRLPPSRDACHPLSRSEPRSVRLTGGLEACPSFAAVHGLADETLRRLQVHCARVVPAKHHGIC